MSPYNDTADLTCKNRARGEGMNMDRLFICGHKGGTTGAFIKRGITMLCAKCNAKRKEATNG